MEHGRKISVIGLGYVGLPVAVAFGEKGKVIGFDIDPDRIKELKNGVDRTGEVEPGLLANSEVLFTSDPKQLRNADFHIIAAPTPIEDSKLPDLTPILRASETVGQQLKPGDIVTYESTVYPGATEEDCVPVLERESGLTCGRDFFVAYSPERINPGDREHTFTLITKVVAGQNPATLDVVAQVYESVVTAGVHRAPSIKVAEAAKVIENTQRDLNIALMNELALIFNRMGIDTHDVLSAAGTKWNFLRFVPGLVGGHCIGVDPYYLTHKATMLGYNPRVILAGRSVNDAMGNYVARQVVKLLIQAGENVKGSVVTILGITFKANVPDLRNTRVMDIVSELGEYGVQVQVHDPLASADEAKRRYELDLLTYDALKPAHAVILAVPHQQYVEQGWQGVVNLLGNGRGIVADVTANLPRNPVPDGVKLWRL
ncbi:MAG: nucleotide sugar dehydrogenase [Gammaproteobacteria bacterium]|nr:nucleotide sugar dehydrogenase [Gammaproteobacteria bacterium]